MENNKGLKVTYEFRGNTQTQIGVIVKDNQRKLLFLTTKGDIIQFRKDTEEDTQYPEFNKAKFKEAVVPKETLHLLIRSIGYKDEENDLFDQVAELSKQKKLLLEEIVLRKRYIEAIKQILTDKEN